MYVQLLLLQCTVLRQQVELRKQFARIIMIVFRFTVVSHRRQGLMPY